MNFLPLHDISQSLRIAPEGQAPKSIPDTPFLMSRKQHANSLTEHQPARTVAPDHRDQASQSSSQFNGIQDTEMLKAKEEDVKERADAFLEQLSTELDQMERAKEDTREMDLGALSLNTASCE